MHNLDSTIHPLTTELQQKVIYKTNNYINDACKLFDFDFKVVDINFNLKGRSSGMYRIKYKKTFFKIQHQREIRYNSYIFSKYFEDNYATTIPHEVAHYVTDIIYGLKNIKPHGKEWKAIMHAFNADDSVTASYDLSGVPRRKLSLFTYRCECREHELTTIRHNRILKQRQLYYCNTCKQALRLKTAEAISNTE